MTPELITKQFDEAQRVLQHFAQPDNMMKVHEAGQLLVDCLKNGRKIMTCGNGGSLCDALHFAQELTGRFKADRPALAALPLGADPSHLTCVGNDMGFEQVFSRQVEALGQPGDILLIITTSGNSMNLLRAAAAAQLRNIIVLGLTGRDGGKLAPRLDMEVRVSHTGWSDRIQEVHGIVIHTWINYIEHQLYPHEAR